MDISEELRQEREKMAEKIHGNLRITASEHAMLVACVSTMKSVISTSRGSEAEIQRLDSLLDSLEKWQPN